MLTLGYFLLGLFIGILSIFPITFYLFRINSAQAEELRVLAQRFNMETLEELPDPNLTRNHANAIKMTNIADPSTNKRKEDYWDMISAGEILGNEKYNDLTDGIPY
jgi:hypothetical protein